MASSSVAKLQKQVAGMQRSRANLRQRLKFDRIRNAAVAGGTAFAIGAIEQRSGSLPTLAGVDPKLAWGGLLTALGMVTKGTPGELIQSSAEGALIAYAYQQGKGDGYETQQF